MLRFREVAVFQSLLVYGEIADESKNYWAEDNYPPLPHSATFKLNRRDPLLTKDTNVEGLCVVSIHMPADDFDDRILFHEGTKLILVNRLDCW